MITEPLGRRVPPEVRPILQGLPAGKNCGIDGIRYEDFKKNIEKTEEETSDILNVIKRFTRSPQTWKHALIRRNPNKNYHPNDLTILRDISLLPTIYKIFSKCPAQKILPEVINKSVNF